MDSFLHFPSIQCAETQLPTLGMQHTAEQLLKHMPQDEARVGAFSFTLARQTLEGEQD